MSEQWYRIAFPDDTSPFDNPSVLEEEVETIYKENDYPEGFTVYVCIDESYSRIYYFTPIAATYCAKLFKSYKGCYCQPPVSTKPIVWVAGEPANYQHSSAP